MINTVSSLLGRLALVAASGLISVETEDGKRFRLTDVIENREYGMTVIQVREIPKSVTME